MGVQGLENFIEKRCPKAFRPVFIADLASLCPHTKNPLVIVHLVACQRHLYRKVGRFDPICGGQHRENLHLWKEFIKKFRDLNLELLFVSNGVCVKAKRETWIESRYKSWTDFGQPAFDSLARGSYPDISGKEVKQPPLQAAQILKLELGCEVHVSTREADEEIMELARARNAVAILGQDTDFVIYTQDQNLSYLSLKHFKLDAMSTFVYDQQELAKHLGLRHPNQLAMLALLKGNDFFSYEEVNGFHKKLVSKRVQGPFSHAVIEALARLVSSKPEEPKEIMRSLRQLLRETLGSTQRLDDAKSLVSGYLLLNAEAEEEVTPGSWKEKTKTVWKFSPCLASIMEGGINDSSNKMEDYRRTDMPVYASLFQSLRQRLYGVLLYEKPGALNASKSEFVIEVVEWFMTKPGSLDFETWQTIVMPPLPYPGLMNLLEAESDDPDITTTKWQMLAHIVSPDLDYQVLRSASPRDVYLLARLFCMTHYKELFLAPWEVRAFILQHLVLPQKTTEDLANIRFPPHAPNGRGVQLASLYCGDEIFLADALCGQPVPLGQLLQVKNFNGKLFQKIYLELKEGNEEDLFGKYDLDKEKVESLLRKVAPRAT